MPVRKVFSMLMVIAAVLFVSAAAQTQSPSPAPSIQSEINANTPADSSNHTPELILASSPNNGMSLPADASPGPSVDSPLDTTPPPTPRGNGAVPKRSGIAAVAAGLMAVALVV